MLIYPTFQTINYSFANSDSTAYVGLQNYQTIFSDSEFWKSIVNNILWLLIVPAVVVAFGVIVAVLADKLSAGGEKLTKSLIFLPMAISAVSASAIWLLVYAYNNPGQAQTGLLNAIWVALGGEPQTWLADRDGKAQLDPAHGHPHLAAGRLRHGAAQLGDQGRPRGHASRPRASTGPPSCRSSGGSSSRRSRARSSRSS